MIYAMSDLHGMYEKYIKMLELTEFSDDDTMYIVGDVVDRGDKPVEILKDMMRRPNVCPIIGNHELMALETLDMMLNGKANAENERYAEMMMNDWLFNGGMTTINGMAALTVSERIDILDYLSDFIPFATADTAMGSFILVHAGFDRFDPAKKLSQYEINDLVWHRPDLSFRYFEDESIYVVAGHTPTFVLNKRGGIIKDNGNILIDCGACFPQGKLGCICLDTLEEFYV